MRYRIGMPFWRIAYRLGFRLYYRYDVYWNEQEQDYCATSPDIKGLNAEAKSLDEIRAAMEYGAQEIVKLDLFGLQDDKEAPCLLSEGLISGGSFA